MVVEIALHNDPRSKVGTFCMKCSSLITCRDLVIDPIKKEYRPFGRVCVRPDPDPRTCMFTPIRISVRTRSSVSMLNVRSLRRQKRRISRKSKKNLPALAHCSSKFAKMENVTNGVPGWLARPAARKNVLTRKGCVVDTPNVRRSLQSL